MTSLDQPQRQPPPIPSNNAQLPTTTRSRQGSSATEKFYYPAPRRRRGNSNASTVMTTTNASLHSHSNTNIPLSYAPSIQSHASTSSQAGGPTSTGQHRPFPLTPPRRRKKTVTEPPVVLNNVVHNMTSLERLRMMTQSLNNAAGPPDFVPPPPPSSSGSVYSTAPSSRSGSGYGQQFTVASVGSNGMMYLRPVNRQFQDPFVVAPATPPKTADQKQSLSELREAPEEGLQSPAIPNVEITNTYPPVPPIPLTIDTSSIHTPKTPKTASPPESPTWQAPLKAPPSSPPLPKVTQHRARSLSIVGDHAKAPQDKSDGVPSRPLTEKFEPPPRPRTAGPVEVPPIHLDVPIPRGTLGSASFSPSGTPFILGSSLPQSNLTEGRKTGSWGNMYGDLKLPWLSVHDKRKPPPTASGISSAITTALPSPVALQASEPIMAGGLHSIRPSIFDSLSFIPLCDDPSIVRYDARTRDITAATPPRIIAQITSAAFLDYQFMSDFFLTFRAFMTPHDLVLYLMARLKWAIDRGDEIGKVVRVRTFVAIRHWLLNYFADDYVPSMELREKFAGLLNELSDDVFARLGMDRSNMNIIAELKKCWRKAAVLYWDGIPGGVNDNEVQIDSHITPGGEAGTREDPRSLKAAFEQDWSRRKGKGRARDSKSSIRRLPASSAFASGATQRLIRDIINAAPAARPLPRPTLARTQDSSRIMQSKPKPRPVSDSSSLYAYSSLNSTTAAAFRPGSPSKGWKPLLHSGHRKIDKHSSHKRSGSYNETSRQNWNPPNPAAFRQAVSPYTSYPHAGDLVRGNLKPPTTAVVELLAPSTPNDRMSVDLKMNGKSKHGQRKGGLSGPSVKRLFVNVKRAFSGRAAPPNDKSTPPLPTHRRGPSEALAKYVVEKGRNVTLTGILSRTESLASESPSASARIDLLGAGVVEAFHNALQEEIRLTSVTPLGRPGDVNASKLTLTIGKALTTMQETPSPNESKGKGREIESMDPSSISEEGDMDGAITPKAKSKGFFSRSKSSSSSTENGKDFKKGKMKSQHSKSPSADWEINGIAMPSPSSPPEIERNSSFSYMTLSKDPPTTYQPGHLHQSSIDSYDSAVTGKFVPRNFSRLGSVISSHIPEYEHHMEDESAISSPNPQSVGSPFARPPNRMLRRRPGGGDLKGAESIGDLGSHARQQSGATLETIETFSDSTMSIWQKHPETEMYSQPNAPHAGVLSLGAMTMKPAPKPVSPDHYDDDEDDHGQGGGGYGEDDDDNDDDDDETDDGSEEVTRENTFEAGVLKLAEMSDTMSDDGGVEVALAKLEGTYNRKQLARALSIHREREAAAALALAEASFEDAPFSPLFSEAPMIQVQEEEIGSETESEAESEFESETESERPNTLAPPERKKQRKRQIIDNDTFTPLPSSGANGLGIDEDRNSGFPFGFEPKTQSFLMLDPEPKTQSFLLLDSDPEDEDDEDEEEDDEEDEEEEDDDDDDEDDDEDDEDDDDDDMTDKADTPPARIMSPESHMMSIPDTIDDHQTISLSDIQRELEDFPSPSRPRIEVSAVEIDSDNMSDLSSEISIDPTHHLPPRPISISSTVLPGLQPSVMLAEAGVPSHPMRHPPSPPLTLDRGASKSPELELPTVDMSTIIPPESKVDPLAIKYKPNKLRKMVESGVHATSIHLPFILAYDSELLAKQFTLIEKDALTEIDWKELVELRWKPTSKPFRDWVEFLKNNDVRGVEIVVARFNLMVSWATSEIVMTRDIYERSRCITKYIHIAAHARRLQNFATTYQLVIALLSADVTRLKKTWSLVAEADRATFRELETLVQPNMNYHNLRREMDLVTGESGCIPFVGLFTHDLIHTATLASQVAGTPNGPALVNWTKYKRTAQIVKKLLRLVDASAKYNFLPIDGVCERCLWMATLTKDEISSLSLEIEPPSEFK
ncbi:Guanine nucleotide exchange factor lte1 [Orbilia oligospora]|nr:Guanine nucleotide exchange factor lte1 [Orbilia oligospora]KAF3257513.1 Guanine nucleotide exchange factor lte1 [Orbilia oligospora]KAF3270640.1 Guanine nucleotide exchange factor lte1 [Orbilia oligospora]